MKTVYWLTRAEDDLPAEADWLSAAEVGVVAGLTVPKRERDWLLGRWTAKRALAALAQLSTRHSSLARLEVHAADDGAPEACFDGEPLPLSLSISHAGGRALCAILEEAAVGCDLEQVEARSELFVRDYFTRREQALVTALPEADRALYENLIWSAKESALKALRVGLNADTHTVEVSLPASGDRGGWRPLEVLNTRDGTPFAGWWRRDGGFVVTFAAPPPLGLPKRLEPSPSRP